MQMTENEESTCSKPQSYHGLYLVRPKKGRTQEVEIGIWYAGDGAFLPQVEADFRAAGMPPHLLEGWIAVLALAVPEEIYFVAMEEQHLLEKAGIPTRIDPVEYFLSNRILSADARYRWRNYISQVKRVEEEQFKQFLRFAFRKSMVGQVTAGRIVTVIAGPLAGKTGVVQFESDDALGIALDGGDIVRVLRIETDIDLAEHPKPGLKGGDLLKNA